MPTRDMSHWRTAISEVISTDTEEEILVRGEKLSELIGNVTFAEMMFLLLQGRRPSPAQRDVLDALLVASMEHGIAPPSMVSRCYASYGTSIQAAVSAGVNAFGDRMGGLGEQLAQRLARAVAATGQSPALIEDREARAIARDIVEQARAAGERVPGYGIPLHGADPRAPGVLKVAQAAGTSGIYARIGMLIEEELATARGDKRVPMNLDGVSAVVILDLGFDWRSTRLFLLTARSVSMGAHYLEELDQDSTWRHIRADQIEYE